MRDWTGKHVLVIGAARQGQALTRYLVDHGAQVTLNDRKPETEQACCQSLRSATVRWNWFLAATR